MSGTDHEEGFGMSGWQPIETAPRDGTEVLLRRVHNYQPSPQAARWQGKDWGVGFGGWPDHAFSHWMPLHGDLTPSLTQAAQAFWEAATNEHERKHAERNGG